MPTLPMPTLPPQEKPRITVVDTQRRQDVIITQASLDTQQGTVTVVSSRVIPIPTAEDTEKFTRLANRWREETRALSSDSDIVANFAYHQIMGMGERALPLIFEEMEAHGGRWFWALRAITGENPIRPEDRGNVRRMTEAWLEWARRYEYV
jgi:hypothetical protein